LEGTPDEYVAAMVAVFREVRRVLAADGVIFVNLGDSYAGSVLTRPFHLNDGADRQSDLVPPPSRDVPMGLKPKDLVGIPWRTAFALQADGWYLRSDIIWSKPNPMPESVRDRPTKAHEYVFLLSKQPRYWFDADAVRERYGDPTREWWNETATTPGNPNRKDGGGLQSRPAKGPDGRRKTGVLAGDASIQHRDGERWPNLNGRNVRSVWEIATQPYPMAHFATFPEELARRCILAGCPEGGTVLDPFAGSGTTGLVARKHGRRSILIELSPDYCELAAKRCQQLSLLAEAGA
jgi:DNA modification methylase